MEFAKRTQFCQCSKLFRRASAPSLVLTAIHWYLFENKRFQGPPVGDMIKKRQAEILAAEKAARAGLGLARAQF